ncbi:FHA domain-containing protein-like protein [Tanacetum coccineum]
MKEQNPSSSSSTTNIKLIIEKGPKEGESIEYKSNKLIKIGRIARGNIFQIKESGISSNHISIHFDNHLNKWMLTDLDSSNGTFLNAQKLQPSVGTFLTDGDCVKIGELTSIIVKLGVAASEEVVELRRNTRRQGRSKAVVEETSELGLDDKLGESVVEDGVGKRNLRGRGKKGVDTKNVVESASSKRILESVEEGDKKKLLPVDVSEGTGLDEQKLAEAVPVAGRRTRRGRMAVAVEPLKNVESGGIEENVVEKLVLTEEGRDGKESAAEGSSVKGSSKVADVDKVKKVAEELESRQDGAEGSMKKTEPDSRKWDLEKMTLGDFFDYIEEQRPKQIIDESEKIIADLEEKARQCYRIRQKAPHPPYKPVTRELVGCTDPICDDIRYPKDHVCEYTNEPCTY